MSESGKRLFGRSSATAIEDSTGAPGKNASTGSVSDRGVDTTDQFGADPGASVSSNDGGTGSSANSSASNGFASNNARASSSGRDGWAETTTTLPAVGPGVQRSAHSAADPYSATVSSSTASRPGVDAAAYAASAPTAARPAVGQPAGQSAGSAADTAGTLDPGAGATAPAQRAKVPKRAERAPRRAKLQVRHLNVWSVLKFSCVLALALFLVWMIVIAVLYGVLDHMHVFSKIDDTVQKINGNAVEQDYVSRNVVFGAALIIGLVNTVLFILLTTIGSVVYNLCADLVGGVEVTLSERE